ncbi:WXG100 family type VII secretion target [Gordonia sp. CPCC 205333]|uniref:WXG100 family type VII secretion target n=1 Tax=Gordonia sp. CPCC 205333 TaxID=3140790 RepID=UPI003AF38DD3
MAGDIFAWRDSAATNAKTRVLSVSTALLGDIRDLDGKIKGRGGWVGTEHDTFTDVFDSWDKAATSVGQILEAVSKLIGAGGDAVVDYKAKVNQALGD